MLGIVRRYAHILHIHATCMCTCRFFFPSEDMISFKDLISELPLFNPCRAGSSKLGKAIGKPH